MTLKSSILLCLQMIMSALPTSAGIPSSLDGDELAWLQQMREEEKLAYDVYSHLYGLYKDQPFANISSAEQRHINAVLWLMNEFKVADKGNPAAGHFNDPNLQALHDKLLEIGSTSREMAFAVGIIVEKLDIADLDKSISATDNQDLIRVYENLRAASYRHLNAYQRGLRRVSESPEEAEGRAMHAIRQVLNSAS